ncbi:hypothetical protein [Streptomyces collinus]|uniref:hypothetical protein n=1 Tax=Streptomyces collinus TaxID=42684 RepID=UPI0036C7EE63
MSDAGGADLRRGLGALKLFQKRVKDALSTFENSPGSSSSIAEHAIGRPSFSGTNADFGEAGELHWQYERVHERLTSLSNSLSLHIEALRLAVHAADVGYDDVDDEVRRRFWEIQTRLNEEHQQAATQPKTDKPDTGHSTDKSAGGGY